jgi:hypothetical protein
MLNREELRQKGCKKSKQNAMCRERGKISISEREGGGGKINIVFGPIDPCGNPLLLGPTLD